MSDDHIGAIRLRFSSALYTSEGFLSGFRNLGISRKEERAVSIALENPYSDASNSILLGSLFSNYFFLAHYSLGHPLVKRQINAWFSDKI